MSVEKLKHCELTYPTVKYTEQTIKVDDDRKTKKWLTETHEAFPIPKKEKKGKKELLMEFFRLQAAKEILEEYLGDTPLPEKCKTEYCNNYCDEHFIPTIEKSEFDIQKINKNPLYDGSVQTLYKEQFDKKNLKVHIDYRNEKRPFARRAIFTTPPEIALDEPVNGY